jgi:hypothetical protein
MAGKQAEPARRRAANRKVHLVRILPGTRLYVQFKGNFWDQSYALHYMHTHIASLKMSPVCLTRRQRRRMPWSCDDG